MNTKNISVLWIHSLVWLALLSSLASADTYTVTQTGDAGPGSLRQALLDAASHLGGDTIVFNIPVTDENYNAAVGVWTIQPENALPDVSDVSTTIDGTSQALFIGSDTNPAGPEIELDGSLAGEVTALNVLSDQNIIRCLTINRFQGHGIVIRNSTAHHNLITGCYVGTDPTGSLDLGNSISGITLMFGPKHNIIGGSTPAERNVISGNGMDGVALTGDDTNSNLVAGNYIGTDATGMLDLGNSQGGVNIGGWCYHNVVGRANEGEGNVISGNDWAGIAISINADFTRVAGNFLGVNRDATAAIPNIHAGIGLAGNQCTIGGTVPGAGNVIAGNEWWGLNLAAGEQNTISGNFIGTNAGGTTDLGNGLSGVYINYGAHDNVLGPDNLITFNGLHGVRVNEDNTVGNTITLNSITDNSELGIDNQNGGNTELTPPTIALDGPDTYVGTAPPSSTVEIFSDGEDEGMIYEGTTQADGAGTFTWNGSPSGPHVTATATDGAGNTSEFSAPYAITAVEDGLPTGLPDRFLLAQNHPNPFNPATTITYHLLKACQVDVTVFDTAGRQVTTLVRAWQEAGRHSVDWVPAHDTVSSGVYFYRIAAGDFTAVRKAVLVK